MAEPPYLSKYGEFKLYLGTENLPTAVASPVRAAGVLGLLGGLVGGGAGVARAAAALLEEVMKEIDPEENRAENTWAVVSPLAWGCCCMLAAYWA